MTASGTDARRRSRVRRDSRTLADIGEFGLLARLRDLRVSRPGVDVGIGDDCAVVRVDGRRWLLTTDALVEGTHFRREWDTPAGLGRRVFMVNASDIAAMGGSPRFALLALCVPASARAAEVEATIRGVAAAASEADCALVGGNLASATAWTLSLTLVGEAVGSPILRSGARAGDDLYVSGPLGGAAFGREILLGERRGSRRQVTPFLRPQARIEHGRWLARAKVAHAAIDLSDGLLADLGHVCEASGVGAVVEADRLPFAATVRRLPRQKRIALSLHGGEDYELLFAVPPDRSSWLEQSARRRRLPVFRIGRTTAERGIRVVGAPGLGAPCTGFDHFRDG